MSVHSAVYRRLLILLERVCGHCEYGDIRVVLIFESSYFLCCLVSVHYGHLYVHKYQLVVARLRLGEHINSDASVFGDFYLKSSFGQYRHRDLLVELVIFGKENSSGAYLVGEIIVLRFRVDYHAKTVPQLRQEQRLAAERRNARFARFLLEFRPVVSRKNDNGNVRARFLVDTAYYLNTVHIGQETVDDINAVIITSPAGLTSAENRLLARKRPLGAKTELLKHKRNAVAGVKVVVDDQRAAVFELVDNLRMSLFCVELEHKRYLTLSADVLFTCYLNSAVHHIDDIFRYRHAETRSLNSAYRGIAFALERLEDMLDELLAHSDARVLDSEFVVRVALGRSRYLGYAHSDLSARARVLHGVAEQIEQHLIKSQLVAENILVVNVYGVDEQFELLVVNVRLKDIAQSVEYFGQTARLFLEVHFAAFDAAHIENVVDKAEQMASRGRDLF